jgi:hypothetical protein
VISHDVPSWKLYTTEAVRNYRDRVKSYMSVDVGWKAGPALLAALNAELRNRGVET